MDVIITAGGIPRPKHPIYKYTKGKPKALLDIAGKQWSSGCWRRQPGKKHRKGSRCRGGWERCSLLL